jgi:hypothetical protein
LISFISLLEEKEWDNFIQQGGTTNNGAKTTVFWLDFFGCLIVARYLWPPRFPDLRPPDFFLLGFLKERLYIHNPSSIDDLEHDTEQAVAGTEQQTLQKLARNVEKRGNDFLSESGGIFSTCCNYQFQLVYHIVYHTSLC